MSSIITSQKRRRPTSFKKTLHLPRTSFPMRANLARTEMKFLAAWDELRWGGRTLADAILAQREEAPPFVVHDGPPYSNGDIHYGHALNKSLKDIVIKSRTMSGYRVQFVPGWDNHGLPIELAVERSLAGDKATPLELHARCAPYAMRWVDAQRTDFRRFGVSAAWSKPYLTMRPEFEAAVLRQLASFVRSGLVYRDEKPVHFCTSCRTALAEAETEHDQNHVSPSAYVLFALPGNLSAVIWTTTPWSLAANQAISYHPGADYVSVCAGGGKYLIAAQRVDCFLNDCGLTEDGPRESIDLRGVADLQARHPFLDRSVPLVPSDHVTLAQGTGLVHIAPGHGHDDFIVGRRHGLAVECPVDDAGVFTRGIWQGQVVFDANPAILEHLHALGALASPRDLKITHAYPKCWRCKTDLLTRATWQWFVRMDGNEGDADTLRTRALEAVSSVEWDPPWGQQRLRGMIESRPDWCLSRQRAWGVPIPAFFTPAAKGGSVAHLDPDVIEHVASIVEHEGVDAWFRRGVADLLPAGSAYDYLRQANVFKGNDIVDVWFESGTSWAAVCEGKPGLDAGTAEDPRPVDLYLEGSDQHRGWFQSSLLTSVATRGRAPYRTVLTHGFVLDKRGRPYSKSAIERARADGIQTDYVPLRELIDEVGAELYRMWAASADFKRDVTFSREQLDQLMGAQQRLRNTARFLLGNLGGLDPDDAVSIPALLEGADGALELERCVWATLRKLHHTVTAAYLDYEFHTALRALLAFTDQLSAVYLNARKDRLYCDVDSPRRRITQMVVYEIVRELSALAAPILCFLAEEIWEHTPKRADDLASIHLMQWCAPAPFASMHDEEDLLERWEQLLELRQQANAALEPFRAAGHRLLDAHVELHLPPAKYAVAAVLGDAELAELFGVSQVTAEAAVTQSINIAQAAGVECARCRRIAGPVELCVRCHDAVSDVRRAPRAPSLSSLPKP